ncbi:hypothetical protein Tco_0597603 [Tanacetum coccineum]
MSTTRQGMSPVEIKQVVAQRVAKAIKAITVYETKLRMANDSIDKVVRQGTTIRKSANNKRKWENNSRDNRVQQPPFKRQNVARAYTAGANEKKAYARNFP